MLIMVCQSHACSSATRKQRPTRERVISSPDRKLKGQALSLGQGLTRRTQRVIRRTGSRSVAIVTIRVIAVPIIARVKPGVPTVKTIAAAIEATTEPAVKTAAEPKTATEAPKTATESKPAAEATKTATSKTTTVEAPAKATGLNGIGSGCRGKHDSQYSKSQW